MRAFTFSFDDGYESWVKAAKILEKYDYRGTFNTVLRNVVHRRMKTRSKMFPTRNVITWEELKQLQKDGHEIACHGTRHIDLDLCNDMELWMEMTASKRVFKSQGIKTDTYTCAFNTWLQRTLDHSEKDYKTFRASVGVNPLPLKGRIYHAMDGTKATQLARTHLDDDIWIIGIWHDVNLKRFESSVNWVKTSNWEIKTVRKMYEGHAME